MGFLRPILNKRMHNPIENEFTARLEWVLADRKITPWAKNLGLSSGTAARLLNNVVPGTDILTAIMRTEHVNLNWLLEGKGAPFMLDSYNDAVEFENMLHVHAQDAPYTAYVNIDVASKMAAVVLTQPASYEFKGKPIHYRQLESLIGPYKAPQKIANALSRCDIKPFQMPPLELTAFSRGQYGTYKLLGDEKHTGIVNKEKFAMSLDIRNFFDSNKDTSSVTHEDAFSYSMDDKVEILNMVILFAEEHQLLNKLDKTTKLEVVDTLEEMKKPVSQITPKEIEFALRASVH